MKFAAGDELARGIYVSPPTKIESHCPQEGIHLCRAGT
jgi:hypothetical protein